MGSLLLAVIYLIFVSLGLPDSLLGSGWPTMQSAFGVPSSYAGYVSMTISCMTILSALLSPAMIRRFHTKWIVIVSILLTVLGLLGFSISDRYWLLFLFALPYGLGAGSIDAAVNHYVASHYSSSVMNFLHCFYGVGAVISPTIMALALKTARWNEGYRWTAFLQTGILLVVLLSLPLWKQNDAAEDGSRRDSAGIRETLRVPGVVLTLIAFFSYCAGEATCFLWTPSYFAGTRPALSQETVAAFGSLIFGGLMLGRLISGFISNKLGDRLLIRAGIALELLGILLVALPARSYLVTAVGFVVVGTGMGPVYPAIQHMAPGSFGPRHSAAVIGLQMASAYLGSTLMPMVFGHLQQAAGIRIMPLYLLVFALLNLGFLELAYRAGSKGRNSTDMCVPCADGILNIRVGAIILQNGRFLMVKNHRADYFYSVGGRIKFGETAEEAVVREVFEETGVKMEIDHLGFIQENYFIADVPSKLGKEVYELGFYFYMKVPEGFAPLCDSITEDGRTEYLAWVSPEEARTIFPAFFRTELDISDKSVKHRVKDDRFRATS